MFGKKKPTMIEADVKAQDLDGLFLMQTVLQEKLVQVDLELVERLIKMVVLSKDVPNTDAEREHFKGEAERLLRQAKYLNPELNVPVQE